LFFHGARNAPRSDLRAPDSALGPSACAAHDLLRRLQAKSTGPKLGSKGRKIFAVRVLTRRFFMRSLRS